MNTFIYLYDELSFSSDLIAYLVEYCVSKNHTAIRYIEATALKWAESGIRTVTAAKQEAKIHSPAYYAVMRSFGITGRNLVPSETDYIEKWRSEYGFRSISSVRHVSRPSRASTSRVFLTLTKCSRTGVN